MIDKRVGCQDPSDTERQIEKKKWGEGRVVLLQASRWCFTLRAMVDLETMLGTLGAKHEYKFDGTPVNHSHVFGNLAQPVNLPICFFSRGRRKPENQKQTYVNKKRPVRFHYSLLRQRNTHHQYCIFNSTQCGITFKTVSGQNLPDLAYLAESMRWRFINNTNSQSRVPGGLVAKDPVLSPPQPGFHSQAGNQPSQWFTLSAGPKPE